MENGIAALLRHTNDDHQADLRSLVSLLSGLPVDHVAGARLDRPLIGPPGLPKLPSGVVLTWVDRNGGQSHWLEFPRPARDAADFATLLRAELAGMPGFG